jgi:preprotein translocase subunit SecA
MLFGFDPAALFAKAARAPEVRHRAAVARIRQMTSELAANSEARLRERAAALRSEAHSVRVREDFAADAVALISEAVRRVRGLTPYDVQLVAGLTLAEGRLAEMATGEGKTLVALLPAFVFALHGKGAHVATVNGYLAERDCEFARPAFEMLGLSVALLPERGAKPAKRKAYAADVTYGVGTEFGFDYLRDQLALRAHAAAHRTPRFHDLVLGRIPPPPETVQRGHAFAIIDEADSVLIDEALSPLVISTGASRPSASPELYRAADAIAARLIAQREVHIDPATQAVALTQHGRDIAFEALADALLPLLRRQWTQYIETALRARLRFRRDVHYIIADGKVQIVDEFTGRACPDRTWREGLHQAVEAAAGVTITEENGSEATITRPAYFRLYQTICGMTGTAREAAAEMRDSYRLPTSEIPLRCPSRRRVLPPCVFATRAAQLAAVVNEITVRRSRGQPVLVGTRTVEMSEALATLLIPAGTPFCMLNARQDAEEASIIEHAGQPGVVTIATNMAGRGVHIPVPPESEESGGLHVIGVELNGSARVDRQLIGRAARQGQRGSAQFFLSLEDELLLRHAPRHAARLGRLRPAADGMLPSHCARSFFLAQRRGEAADRQSRRALAAHDRWLDELKQAL